MSLERLKRRLSALEGAAVDFLPAQIRAAFQEHDRTGRWPDSAAGRLAEHIAGVAVSMKQTVPSAPPRDKG